MIIVSRKEHFNAAHKLYNESWSEEKNNEVFGPCANSNWHGHNFNLIVSVKGEIDSETGYVVDMKILSDIVNKEIIDAVDHKNLNLDVPFMRGIMPSCENMVIKFWDILEPKINEVTNNGGLYSIILEETKNNSVEYYGH